MRIEFTKMQGAGNDFVVLDETRGRLGLGAAQYRFLADRHFGVGADQILSVRPAPAAGLDFEYLIHNADGGEVEQCGNGARCFARFVHDKGLTHKTSLRVQTRAGVIAPRIGSDGRVSVDMGPPRFAPQDLPFDATGLLPVPQGEGEKWPLALADSGPEEASVLLALVSIGNPHAVQLVDCVQAAPVAATGPLIANHRRFAQRVNAGFAQIVDRGHVRLRVYERGVGETLACGSGACAAVAAGVRLGLLDPAVQVQLPGGQLSVSWNGSAHCGMVLGGPATTVFEGRIDIPPCT